MILCTSLSFWYLQTSMSRSIQEQVQANYSLQKLHLCMIPETLFLGERYTSQRSKASTLNIP